MLRRPRPSCLEERKRLGLDEPLDRYLGTLEIERQPGQLSRRLERARRNPERRPRHSCLDLYEGMHYNDVSP